MVEPGRKSADRTAHVETRLRQAILAGELAPGEFIRQEKWAAALNVSRLPVREALKVLTSEGLLGHDPHRGYHVVKLDVDEMAQIYLMRRVLEPELIKTISWPTDGELGRLREIARESEEALARRDAATCLNLERAIDYQVYDLSRLKLVVREVKRLWELADPYRYLVFAEPVLFSSDDAEGLRNRHLRLFEALEAQDHEALQRALSRNFGSLLPSFRRPPFLTDTGTGVGTGAD
jgi:DNA-binding GntR family transcriptional regulator